ncbi:MAG: hypothetical protein K2G18_04025 [Bacteroidales bacterium]|nr:hypothetical protein [Bacteroidales bacterium]
MKNPTNFCYNFQNGKLTKLDLICKGTDGTTFIQPASFLKLSSIILK